jgi:hypothetical protein
MFTTVLAYASNTVVVAAIALVVGVVFSQKIKDFFTGVPSELRAAMSAVEAKTKADLQAATGDVLSKLPTGVAKVVAPVAPVAPEVAPKA